MLWLPESSRYPHKIFGIWMLTEEIRVATKEGGMMLSAGIKEVKNNLSRLLARVKSGEVVVITDRGKAVTRIVKENQEDKAVMEALMPLVEQGLIALPIRGLVKEGISATEVPGKPVSEIVIEDRR